MSKEGFLYIATADEYIDEAKVSAKITKRWMDVPVALVAHREIESPYLDTVIVDEDPDESLADKPGNLLKTPYEKTVFLDTDAYLLEPVPAFSVH